MTLPTLDVLRAAATTVYKVMPPTPQYVWPQLNEAVGATVWVKHENHTPTGAFKIRGSLTFMDWLRRNQPGTRGIVTATRGNHGQGQSLAATANGLIAKIIVPHGNSAEKNAAMTDFGGTVIEYGSDFDEAKHEAFRIAEEENLTFVPPYHPALVSGVATYAMELFEAARDLDTIYVPIGCGSGICGIIAAREALGRRTEVVGVVAEGANYAALSFAAGRLVSTNAANTFADGMAVREGIPEAFAVYGQKADRVVEVSDDAIADAMRLIFKATHNVAEGAGAAPLAALMAEREAMAGKRAGVILCGQNVDTGVFAAVLNGQTPTGARISPA